MLGFLGDLHGNMDALQRIHDEVIQYPEIKALIQVGDFGWYPDLRYGIKKLRLKIPIYGIKGNHEHWATIRDLTDVTEMQENLFYVPNGTVLELDGRKIAFCGGAGSVDKKWQLATGEWSDDENIRDEEIRKFDSLESCDILVTHVPPQSIIQKAFSPMGLLAFGLPITWKDHNADKIEALWKRLNYPMNICGHMHKRVNAYQCRILDINELFCM